MNVVVTGGGTIALIDDVRHITNSSTGRFSAMITEACLERGASVWHVHSSGAQLPYDRLAHYDLSTPDPDAESKRLARLRQRWAGSRDRLRRVPLREGTVAEYARELEGVFRGRRIDLAFLAMAVSDFEPVAVSGKLRSITEKLIIECHPAPKVIRSVRDWAPDVYLVGFKLLSRVSEDELKREAKAACVANRADLTVANDLQTLRGGRHTIHLVRPGRPAETYGPEVAIAERLVDRAMDWAAERRRL